MSPPAHAPAEAMRPFADAPSAALAAITLIATDIDGTLTRAGKLHADILAAMGRLAEAGVAVLPVTGRPAGEALGLARYLPHVHEAIAENGAVLVRPNQDVVPLWNPPDHALLRQVAAEISDDDSPLHVAEDAFCRVGDLAFLRENRPDREIELLRERGLHHGVFVIWSSVHIHLSLQPPDKGAAVLSVSAERGVRPGQILTIGDAPNDAGLWQAGRFGVTVGTSDVRRHVDALPHLPSYVCAQPGADAWLVMAERLLAARTNASDPGAAQVGAAHERG